MHTVAVIAMHGVLAFDLSTPCEVFSRAVVPGEASPYQVLVCGEAAEVKAGPFDLRVPWDLSQVAGADTVIVPGIANPLMPISQSVTWAIQEAAARGARIASICTGAFVLAATGLLDGLQATTHWLAAPALAARYPRIRVDPNVLYVDNGQLLTSAGAAAGIDLCLHLVRQDYGAAVAAHTAKLTVMPLERPGGQAQFIVHPAPASDTSLAPLLLWLEANLGEPLTLGDLARQAGMSERSLSRHFRAQTGTTPLQWILTARIRHAQALLETQSLSAEKVASAVGFESVSAFRDCFYRRVGTTPQRYRQSFAG
ncbi:GlxA family transcriptional regulator [Deinococcus sp.]|uniref:GlxA family transcriptional regulator n=1 Tax=Deinococcus sp. TaxID=47478 RepID=UPI003CC57BFD